MKICLIGYGKMGKEVEKTAHDRGHEVILRLDSEEDWVLSGLSLQEADAAIEFSVPGSALNNIRRCFSAGVPVVTGTTGWFDHLNEIRELCAEKNQALFYAPNFSIGVNLFFMVNRYLAGIMNHHPDYQVFIEETHHTQKLDAPSGTAITLARDIIGRLSRKETWVNDVTEAPSEIGIRSFRIGDITGTHVVTYDSDIDTIELKHTAKSRRGFAQGAVMAAEWLAGKKGVFTMEDMIAG